VERKRKRLPGQMREMVVYGRVRRRVRKGSKIPIRLYKQMEL